MSSLRHRQIRGKIHFPLRSLGKINGTGQTQRCRLQLDPERCSRGYPPGQGTVHLSIDRPGPQA